jgi:two-component system, OmpR family, alkaline phosphatase synthesis response regulator PhoP
MSKEKILVVDDEEDILELVRYTLVKDGFQVQGVTSGELALAKAKEERPDLIVLDLMLPGVDGLDVCRRLRSGPDTATVPIVMLTAKTEDADVVTGLELGADDYVTKPFSPRVLLARIKAVLRRRLPDAQESQPVVRTEDLTINPSRHEVLAHGRQVVLTATEFRILYFLARRPGWVFTRDQIISAVKGDDYPVTERSVDVQIVGLRKKLGEAGENVETVRGVGYRFRER